jgi:hypothetical protein
MTVDANYTCGPFGHCIRAAGASSTRPRCDAFVASPGRQKLLCAPPQTRPCCAHYTGLSQTPAGMNRPGALLQST